MPDFLAAAAGALGTGDFVPVDPAVLNSAADVKDLASLFDPAAPAPTLRVEGPYPCVNPAGGFWFWTTEKQNK